MVATIIGALMFFLAVVCLIKESVRERIGGWIAEKRGRIWLLPSAILAFYSAISFLFNVGQADIFWKIALYFGAPTMLLFLRGPRFNKGTRWDLAVDFLLILMLWLPIEFRWMMKSWWPMEIAIAGKEVRGLGYPINVLAAVAYLLIVYGGYRKIDIQCDWSLTWPDFRLALKMCFVLFAVLVPMGWAIGFLNPGINSKVASHWWAMPLVLASFFFAPGFSEELVSRGGMQNLFTSWFGSVKGICLTAAIFGFSHINNSVKPNFPTPNWTYVGFATFAGLIYGYLYWRRKVSGAKGALVIGAMLHAFVDFTWLIFFKGGS